jgi:hypothetical protein
MFNLAKCASALKIAAVLVCSAPALLGCGTMDDVAAEDDVGEDTQAAVTNRIFVQCPAGTMSAQWIQAANGRTSSLGSVTSSIPAFQIAQPSTTLTCAIDSQFTNLVLRQTVFLQPGSVESACGAKATITGPGRVLTGIPPFGGFPFKSSRLTATPTYDPRSGQCQLEIPLRPAPFLSVKVTQTCDPLTATVWSCPPGTLLR